MPERVGKPSLAMATPWHPVIPEGVEAALCARFQSAGNERIGIVAEDFFDSGGSDTGFRGTFPSVLGRFTREERGSLDFQTRDRPTAP
jgi:hypothetical protein